VLPTECLAAALTQIAAREELLLDLVQSQVEAEASPQTVWRYLSRDIQGRLESAREAATGCEVDLEAASRIQAAWQLETQGWLQSMGELAGRHRNPAQEAGAVAALLEGDWQALDWIAVTLGDPRLRETARHGLEGSATQRSRLQALVAATLS